MNSSSQVHASLIAVPPECDGQRIDNFLLRTLKGVPRSLVYRILRKGEVRVNRGRIRPDYRLQAGDQVRIPPLRTSREENPAQPPQGLLARLEQAVVWENPDILVIDKPAGLAVHGGSGLAFGLIEAMRALRPQASFLELAHRLDRETSGCLMLAKTPAALKEIHDGLRVGVIEKRYLVLVRGRWDGGVRELSAPLRKNAMRGGERMVQVVEQGKAALTWFRPISVYSQASLLEARIATGRTHQIRVHAAHLGYPVAGDHKYGDAEFNREMATIGLRRLFLHAHQITLPLGNKEISVTVPLGEGLNAVLESLQSVSRSMS